MSRAVAAGMVVISIASCQLAIDGDLDSVACSDEGAEGPPDCQIGFRCDQGKCVVIESTPGLGQRCTDDSSCGDLDKCLTEDALTGTSVSVCARTCCTSSDCGPSDDGFVCWVPDLGGASFCRSSSEVGRGAVGKKKPGAPCEEDANCRSGLCQESRCLDGCCSDTNCTAQGVSCVASSKPTPAWRCGATPVEGGNYLAMCETDEDGRSRMCVKVGSEKRCSMPCCGSPECGSLEQGELPAFVACEEVEHAGGWLHACARLLPPGAVGVVGVPCEDDLECRSGQCMREPGQAGICSDVCCDDGGCGDVTAFGCGLAARDPTWSLRCEPK